ncbi:MAG TPA: thioredoxin domain-containing protein [Acidobacteriota bacterium]|nr:thioredoxin domain-containing protein [Acidobacteriota bacterium]
MDNKGQLSNSERPNRLIQEKSPYLLQHAHNPVDWYPWGTEALEAARNEDKPILLSIGYSACHWCHVMEHESFENQDIAQIMNRHFVNIKVDREERPDLDSIYMNYVQMTTGHGGWPLTVFLTPELVPFYGGTYFPPEDRGAHPGFRKVLTSVAHFYTQQKDQIEEKKDEIVARLARAGQLQLEKSAATEELLEQAFYGMIQQLDTRNGGFGEAPKFPSSMILSFLLRYHRRTGADSAREAVVLSLDKMARGGIYDQLGGGFHRYAVDAQWLVPHFEKMLYDNALLARAYLEAHQVTGVAGFRQIVEETLRYVQRDLVDESGGFYSSEDADSDGEEGKFYTWSERELRECLTSEEFEVFSTVYGVTPEGNWEGRNILNRLDVTAPERLLGTSQDELDRLLKSSREKLLLRRNSRVRPGRDDKVLASWNGMMLATFSEAALVLSDTSLRETAEANAWFLLNEIVKDGRVHRSWKEGEATLNGYLDDYAHVVEGLIAVYSLTGEYHWLKKAVELTEKQLELFFDGDRGDFFFTSNDHEALLVRQKEYFDNAIPSGNATSVLNLLKLHHLTGERKYEAISRTMIEQMAAGLARYPSAFGYWLQAVDFLLGPVYEIALVGALSKQEELLAPIKSRFIPNRIIARSEGNSGADAEVPLLEGREAKGEATLYLCRNYTCLEPASSVEQVEKVLGEFASE